MTDRTPLLRAVSNPLRKMIRQGYNADSCIASTRIAIDILHALGIPAEPLAVELTIFNKAFVDRFAVEGRLPNTREETETWYRECGAHSLGVGRPRGDNPGLHMVAIVERALLWDVAVDQANRPEKGINLDQPIIAPVTEEFLSGRGSMEGRSPDGAVLIYKARPGYEPWLVSGNWREDGYDAPLRKRMVVAALTEIRRAARDALQRTA